MALATPGNSLIEAPRSVRVSIQYQNSKTVTRTLGATAAGQLAERINKLNPDAPGELRSCGRSPLRTTTALRETLVFDTASGTIQADGYPFGCHPTKIYRDGKPVITLNGDVGQLLSKLLDLPSFSEYG